MTDSLRDQLLGLGFKPAAKPDKPARPTRDAESRGRPNEPGADRGKPDAARRPPHPARPHSDAQGRQPGRPGGQRVHGPREGASREGRNTACAGQDRPARGAPRSREDIDLAKAYAIRAQREKDERIAAEKAKQDQARLRREAKATLAALLKDKALNDPAADIARHFDYGGKIKRIYVNAEQLKALNAGELGVVQLDGRYVLVSAALLTDAEAIFAPAIALKVDPSAPAGDDPYADPQYQVPDDLVW